MNKECEVELKAKVIAFQEGLEPTEVVCPVKEFCKGKHCVFMPEGGSDMPISDELKIQKLRDKIKQISNGRTTDNQR